MPSIAHARGIAGKLRGAVFRHFLQTPGRNVVLQYQGARYTVSTSKLGT